MSVADDAPSLLERVAAAIEAGDDRDKQRRIGPSEIGNVCQRCLAGRLIGEPEAPRKGYPLAPWIGTAVHAHLESKVGSQMAGALLEHKVEVGVIPGYGPVKGTADLYVAGKLGDYKVMSKKNIAALQRAFVIRKGKVSFADTPKAATARQYWVQQNLYAAGLVAEGHEVLSCSLLLIPRDASTDTTKDIKEITFTPDPRVAQAALERAGKIYEWAIAHPDALDELPSDRGCFTCKFLRQKERE